MVSVPTPSRAAPSTTSRAARAPATCPAPRGRRRAAAQRPFPSMMMATCRELCMIKFGVKKKRAGGGATSLPLRHLDERFHVVHVAPQRRAAVDRQAELGARHAPLEGLRTRDVAGVLELARVDAEVAVGRAEELLELVEGERLAAGEGAHDPEAQPLVDDPIEIEGHRLGAALHAVQLLPALRGLDGAPALRGAAVPGECAVLSHRTSARSGLRTRRGAPRSRCP